jgi:hypothetical protein
VCRMCVEWRSKSKEHSSDNVGNCWVQLTGCPPVDQANGHKCFRALMLGLRWITVTCHDERSADSVGPQEQPRFKEHQSHCDPSLNLLVISPI